METGSECGVCFDTYSEQLKSSKAPILVPCGHTFCRECVVEWCRRHESSKTFPCPSCNRRFDLKGAPSDFGVVNQTLIKTLRMARLFEAAPAAMAKPAAAPAPAAVAAPKAAAGGGGGKASKKAAADVRTAAAVAAAEEAEEVEAADEGGGEGGDEEEEEEEEEEEVVAGEEDASAAAAAGPSLFAAGVDAFSLGRSRPAAGGEDVAEAPVTQAVLSLLMTVPKALAESRLPWVTSLRLPRGFDIRLLPVIDCPDTLTLKRVGKQLRLFAELLPAMAAAAAGAATIEAAAAATGGLSPADLAAAHQRLVAVCAKFDEEAEAAEDGDAVAEADAAAAGDGRRLMEIYTGKEARVRGHHCPRGPECPFRHARPSFPLYMMAVQQQQQQTTGKKQPAGSPASDSDPATGAGAAAPRDAGKAGGSSASAYLPTAEHVLAAGHAAYLHHGVVPLCPNWCRIAVSPSTGIVNPGCSSPACPFAHPHPLFVRATDCAAHLHPPTATPSHATTGSSSGSGGGELIPAAGGGLLGSFYAPLAKGGAGVSAAASATATVPPRHASDCALRHNWELISAMLTRAAPARLCPDWHAALATADTLKKLTWLTARLAALDDGIHAARRGGTGTPDALARLEGERDALAVQLACGGCPRGVACPHIHTSHREVPFVGEWRFLVAFVQASDITAHADSLAPSAMKAAREARRAKGLAGGAAAAADLAMALAAAAPATPAAAPVAAAPALAAPAVAAPPAAAAAAPAAAPTKPAVAPAAAAAVAPAAPPAAAPAATAAAAIVSAQAPPAVAAAPPAAAEPVKRAAAPAADTGKAKGPPATKGAKAAAPVAAAPAAASGDVSLDALLADLPELARRTGNTLDEIMMLQSVLSPEEFRTNMGSALSQAVAMSMGGAAPKGKPAAAASAPAAATKPVAVAPAAAVRPAAAAATAPVAAAAPAPPAAAPAVAPAASAAAAAAAGAGISTAPGSTPGVTASGHVVRTTLKEGLGIDGTLAIGASTSVINAASEAAARRDGKKRCPEWSVMTKTCKLGDGCTNHHLRICPHDIPSLGGGRCAANKTGKCPYWHFRPCTCCKSFGRRRDPRDCRYGDNCTFLHVNPAEFGLPELPTDVSVPAHIGTDARKYAAAYGLPAGGRGAASAAAAAPAPAAAAPASASAKSWAAAGTRAAAAGGSTVAAAAPAPATAASRIGGGRAAPPPVSSTAAFPALGAAAPAAPADAGGVAAWTCPACTYVNDVLDASCQMCETAQPAGLKAARR